jgi:predicted small secreted protein
VDFHWDKRAMRKLLLLTLAGAALMVSACNTIEGAGKDVASAGRAISQTAHDASK